MDDTNGAMYWDAVPVRPSAPKWNWDAFFCASLYTYNPPSQCPSRSIYRKYRENYGKIEKVESFSGGTGTDYRIPEASTAVNPVPVVEMVLGRTGTLGRQTVTTWRAP